MIRWIFFDVGNVLFNDDPQTYHIHRRCHAVAERRSPQFTFARFLDDREREVARGNRWPIQSVLLHHLSPEELDAAYRDVSEELRGIYDSVNLPMPGALPLVRALADRYRLGIVANQFVECRGALARRGLLEHFDVVAISEELGLYKPDPALFRWALDQSGADAREVLMIGDRHDNDIVPAASLGMSTIWVRWRTWRDKGWEPEDPYALEFLAAQDRQPFYGRVTRDDVQPWAIVEHLREAAPAIDAIVRSSHA